jgi:chromosome segregation protein
VTARRDATAARISELSRVIGEETARVEEARAELARAQAAMESDRQTTEKLRQTLHDSEEQQRQHQSDLAQAEKEIARVDRVIAEKQARLEVLRQMTEEGEGLEKGSQAVLKGLNDPDRIRPALAGALVANLNVDREFVPALEAAFGRAMHAVVLNKTELAAEIFQTLQQDKAGQAALAISEWSTDLPNPRPSKLPKGALSWAIEKVDAPEALQPIVRSLLRDVAIVSDLAMALELKKRGGHFQYATLGGEFVSAEGIIFGGSTSTASDSLLGRKTILTDLSRERDALDLERQAVIDQRDGNQKRLEAGMEAVDEARQSHEAAQQNQSQASVQVLSAERAVQERHLDRRPSPGQLNLLACHALSSPLGLDSQPGRREVTSG